MSSESGETDGAARAPKLGPPLSMRWGLVVAAMIGAAALFGCAWGVIAPRGGWIGWPLVLRVVPVVLAIALLGWLAAMPWRPRPAVDWVTVWLGGTLARLLLTPLACFGLYSFFPCESAQFIAAAGGCCFAVVLAEVGMIAATLPTRSGSAAR
ncbi:MAG: hypothetical protein FJ256_06005 [Phycisphaerae bacterium]|nr:hypothetical protein [Phycisphaerae bacterium]